MTVAEDQLFGAEHVRAYRESSGERGYHWHGTTILLLTTRERTSGELRTTPLIYRTDDGRWVIVASRGGTPTNPSWFENLRADPEATIQMRGEVIPVRADAATGEERERLWSLMTEVWPAGDPGRGAHAPLERIDRASRAPPSTTGMLRVAERWGTAPPSPAQLREETMSAFYISEEMVDEAAAGGIGVFAAGGEIDYAASPLLDEHIARHINAGARHLVIDLSAATFIDSTAIGVLMVAVGSLQEACGGTLAVVCVHRNLLKILEISGLQAAIAIYRTREEAVSALALVA